MSPRWLHWPASWTPSDLADLRAWYDADDSTTIYDATTGGSLPSSGNDVARWEDKSGGGYHVTQATAANCPHYVTNTLNGKPVIECTSQWLTAATASDWKFLHDATGSTVVAVWRPGNSTNPDAVYPLLGTNGGTASKVGVVLQYENRSIVDGADNAVGANISGVNGANVAWMFVPGGTNPIFTGFNGLAVGGTASVNSWVLDPSSNTAANRVKVNRNGGVLSGNQTFTGSVSTSNPAHQLQIGSMGNNVMPMTGYIAEVVICDAKLSDANREKLEGYLAHKWGLEANLPSTHPYRNSAP